MTNKSEVGKLGEDLACGFLVKKGYKILKRNYWKPWGELDIVAKDPDGVLVFVEVKAMRRLAANTDLLHARNEATEKSLNQGERKNFGGADTSSSKAPRRPGLETGDALQPEDNLTRAKLIKLKRTAELFVSSRPELVDEERGYQIDLLAIMLEPLQISHYENV
ncbi:MAG: YraN family protein [Patescibacteria group bacterium]